VTEFFNQTLEDVITNGNDGTKDVKAVYFRGSAQYLTSLTDVGEGTFTAATITVDSTGRINAMSSSTLLSSNLQTVTDYGNTTSNHVVFTGGITS
jgi:hypothetical protein